VAGVQEVMQDASPATSPRKPKPPLIAQEDEGGRPLN
jgi:hypothetical protein